MMRILLLFIVIGCSLPVKAQWVSHVVTGEVRDYQFAGWTSGGKASFVYVEDDNLYFSELDSLQLTMVKPSFTGIKSPVLWTSNLKGNDAPEMVISGVKDGKAVTEIFEVHAESDVLRRLYSTEDTGNVTFGEVNADGLIDVVISNDSIARWHLNSRNGFESCATCPNEPLAGTFDMDNNGRRETISKGIDEWVITTISKSLSTDTMEELQWGDFSRSGYPDLLYLENGVLNLLENLDGISLDSIEISRDVQTFKLLDFTNDGHLDIVASTGDKLLLLEWDSDSTVLYEGVVESFVYGDVDKDLDLDLLVQSSDILLITQEDSRNAPINPDSISYQSIVTEKETVLQWSGVNPKYTYNVRAWDASGQLVTPTFNTHGNAGYANRYVYENDTRIAGWSVTSVNHNYVEGIDPYECELGMEDQLSLEVCEGEFVNLEEYAKTTWFQFVNDASIPVNPQFIAQNDAIYHANFVDSLGEFRNMSIELAVLERPDISVSLEPLCEDGDVAESIKQDLETSYDSVKVWSIEGNSFVFEVLVDGFACSAKDTIEVEFLPKVDVRIAATAFGRGHLLTASGADQYEWTGPVGSHSGSEWNVNPVYLDVYTVVGSRAGFCSDTTTIQFGGESSDPDTVVFPFPDPDIMSQEERSQSLIIPNLFSPDNDGTNDMYFIRGKDIGSIHFKIYTKDGILVYETEQVDEIVNNEEKGWDGRINGNPAPADVYIWYMSGTFKDGTRINNNGNKGIINLIYP